ncbi:hypothetical protein [Kitasatospora sp. NPDC048407]|uniref:hypothetical protein n=1 Tax=Kitasatospora sp. NPDC048407 TaxID=3364051 RepID=UPI00372135A1
MTSLAAQAGSGGGVFLLIWSVAAMAMGGALATKKWSTRFKDHMVQGLAPRPLSQQRAARQPVGVLRFVGGALAVSGAVALPIAVVIISRG